MGAKTERKEKTAGGIFVLKCIKALMVSLIITFACIIIFAFIIKWANLPDSVISPVNLAIKGISVFSGALILTKRSTKGIFKGFLFAIIYTLVAFTIFSSLAGEFVLGLGLISDFAFAGVVGAIAGILGANLKGKF